MNPMERVPRPAPESDHETDTRQTVKQTSSVPASTIASQGPSRRSVAARNHVALIAISQGSPLLAPVSLYTSRRTDLSRAVMKALIEDGVVETRSGDDDPAAIALMHRLADNSRRRWPDWAEPAVRVDQTERAT